MNDADLTAVEQAVLAVDGVASLHGGAHGTVATYRPGRRIPGLRVGADSTQVHLAIYEGHDLAAVAERVRVAVARMLAQDGRSVVITIEDLVPYPTAVPTNQESS